MKRIDLRRHDEANAIAVALEVLRMGGIVAFPTETFYGLGAMAGSEEALSKLFALKDRSTDKAASLIVGTEEEAQRLAADIPPLAQKLMAAHWPGPLTLVLRAAEGLSGYITKEGTVALRVPGDSFALHLARAAGFPITATSANPAGEPPAETADDVESYFGDSVNLLIDGGRAPGGKPSTIVDATGSVPRVLRQGVLNVSGPPDED
jgi:L-threonylcarbamoyladenylate synthase